MLGAQGLPCRALQYALLSINIAALYCLFLQKFLCSNNSLYTHIYVHTLEAKSTHDQESPINYRAFKDSTYSWAPYPQGIHVIYTLSAPASCESC